MIEKPNTPEQRAFDAKYISAPELAELLGIARSQLTLGISQGRIGDPIIVGNNGAHIWERELITDQLVKWQTYLEAHRALQVMRANK